MKKSAVFLVFFVILFFLSSAHAQEKKKIIKEETTVEESTSESVSKGETRGGAVSAKKPAIKKKPVKKKTVMKKTRPSSSKKTATAKSSKRYVRKTTRTEEEVLVSKPEPPKVPPCEVKLLKLEPHPTAADAVVFVGASPYPAEMWMEYSIVAEEVDDRIKIYPSPEAQEKIITKKIPSIAGWEVESYSFKLKQNILYRGRMAGTYNGATCYSAPINFQMLKPKPPATKAKTVKKEPGKWTKFFTCTGSMLVGFGATTANPGLVALGTGFMVTGYMANDYDADYKRMIFCGGMGIASGAAYHYAEGSEAAVAASEGSTSSTPATPSTLPATGPGGNPSSTTGTGPGPNPDPTAPGPNPAP